MTDIERTKLLLELEKLNEWQLKEQQQWPPKMKYDIWQCNRTYSEHSATCIQCTYHKKCSGEAKEEQ